MNEEDTVILTAEDMNKILDETPEEEKKEEVKEEVKEEENK